MKTPSTIKISVCGAQKCSNLRFEYGVILNGSQTATALNINDVRFEYGVSDEDMYNAIKNHYFEYKSFFDLIK